jgi:TolB-like protein/DNA-binding winged helix-turn-helix (wHTH) protein/Flp pilus assembly protein TadD
MSDVDPKSYRFGPFHVDLEQRLLFRGGVPVSLAQKAFDTLAILVSRRGQVVDKSELMKLVWPETFVEENNLTQNISTLRKVLGEGEYIETIPRRGYRFVMRVEDPPSVSVLPADPELIQSGPIHRVRRWIWFALGILVVAGLAYFTSMRFRGRGRANRPVDSLVVLPFVNLSANPDNEYFSDGLTEEITHVLAHIEGLRVVARTTAFQFKGKAQDIRAIARQLHVNAVLEGSVRRDRNRLRVTAQLNDAEAGYHIWSQTYDRDEGAVFQIQEDISRQIARAVRPNGSSPPAVPGSRNLEAYNSYLKGRYYWNKRTGENLKTAIGHFENAIAKDPEFALAWSGLADCHVLTSDYTPPTAPQDSYPKARSAAQKALVLDGTLAEAYTTLAYIKLQYDRDWAGAESDFRKALQLNPGYATAHQWYGQYLLATGRPDEALAELKRAQELDPVSLIIQANIGRVHLFSRRYDQAIEQLRATLTMDPNFPVAHAFAGLAWTAKSMYSEAISEYQTSLKLTMPHLNPYVISYLGYAYARCGKRAEAQEILHELAELSKRGYLPAETMATVYIGLGDKDRAFHWLRKSVEERGVELSYLKVNPLFDPIRSDPRFRDLLRSVNLAP